MKETVKIDAELLDKINKIIREKLRLKYPTAKQFVNMAVLELFEKEGVR